MAKAVFLGGGRVVLFLQDFAPLAIPLLQVLDAQHTSALTKVPRAPSPVFPEVAWGA